MAAIRRWFPEIGATTCRRLPGGWEFLVMSAGEWVVRCALDERSAGRLLREAELLDGLAEVLSTPIPRPELRHEGGSSWPPAMVAYRRLPGEPLDPARLGPREERSLATAVGHLLSELHSLDPAGLVSLPRPDPGDVVGWLRREVLPQMGAAAGRLDELIDEHLDLMSRAPRDHRVLHGDIGPANLLVRGGLLCGVIDWTDAFCWDPAFDLGRIWGALGRRFAGLVLAAYTGPVDPELWRRAGSHARYAPVEALHQGVTTGDQAMVARALACLRRGI